MTPAAAAARPTSRGRRLVPFAVLATAVLLTGAATAYLRREGREQEQARFHAHAGALAAAIDARLGTYVAFLRSGAALFAASDSVTYAQFAAFVGSLELEREYPGIRAVGFAPRIDPAEAPIVERIIRRELGVAAAVRPEGVRTERYPVLYVSPLDSGSRSAVGYDMFAEPIRRAAMERARDTGRPAVSGGVTLVQAPESARQPGFLLYLPVYEANVTAGSVEQRRQQIRGFVYAPFRVRDFIDGVLGTQPLQDVAFRIYDGPDESGNLTYDSDPHAWAGASAYGAMTESASLTVYGRPWTIEFVSLPGYPVGAKRELSNQIFLIGALISLLLFLLTRAQSAAREEAEVNEARFRSLVDQSPLSIQIARPDGGTVAVNAAFERLWGIPMAQLRGYNLLQDPQLRERGVTPYIRTALDGHPAAIPPHAYHPDRGAFAGARRWVQTVVYPVRTDAGEVREIVLIHQDITDQREAADQLRYQLEVMDTITSHAADALFLVDGDGRVTYMNPAAERSFGWDRAELLGRELHAAVHDHQGEGPIGCGLQRVLSAGRTVADHHDLFRHRDGRAVPVTCSSAPIAHADRPPGAVLVVRDDTERKRTEEALRQTQKLESIGILAGGIAHDFNNLLTGIMGNASLAQLAVPPDSAARPLLDDVLRASARAADLTSQLLAYAGKGRFYVQEVDVGALVAEIAGLVRSSIPKKVELEMDLAEKLPAVEADPSQLQQLVMNLVINGAEAIADASGRVSVRVRPRDIGLDDIHTAYRAFDIAPGRYVELLVEDTGSGMDDETLAQIFDPFFTTKFTGRGLGLAAALGIVRGHGGAVAVQTRPARGTTFSVLLPALGREAPAPATNGPPTAVAHPVGTVLVVDDEDVVRDTACAVLEASGFTVACERDGPAGLERLRRDGPAIDLVLLDLRMPRMGGDEVIGHLREIRPDVPVIVTSGFDEEEVRNRFADWHISGVLKKPYTADQLVEAVRKPLREGREIE